MSDSEDIDGQAESNTATAPSTTPSTNPPPLLIQFFSTTHSGTDPRGRTLSQILAWDDTHLEYSHDYIQTLFPLPEASDFNSRAVVVDERVYAAFAGTDEMDGQSYSAEDLRANLGKALDRMAAFYGLKVQRMSCEEAIASGIVDTKVDDLSRYRALEEDGKPTTEWKHAYVHLTPLPSTRGPSSKSWATRRIDHNHLRISRIIRSLRVLSCPADAEGFFRAVKGVYHASNGRVGARSMEFWTKAATRGLWLAPDEGDDAKGRAFLRGVKEW